MTQLRLLTSYAYFPKGVASALAAAKRGGATEPPQIIADSGAYSVKSMGWEVTLPDYVAWLHANLPHLTAYANLDVIGDHAATAVNQELLEREGLAPFPVWHMVSPLVELERLCERYRYVAIGGMTAARHFGRFMPHAITWHETAQRYGTVLHGFGMSDWRIISLLPWYSIDSSSITSGYRYGLVGLYDPEACQWRTIKLYNRAKWGKWAPLVRQWGFNPEDFIDKATFRRAPVVALAILSWLAAERDLRARHGPIGVERDGPPFMGTTAPGLFMYSADSSRTNIARMTVAARLGRWDPVESEKVMIGRVGGQGRLTKGGVPR